MDQDFRTPTKLFNNKNELLGEFNSLSAAAAYSAQFGCSVSSMKKNKKTKNGYYVEMAENEKLNKKKAKIKVNYELFSPENESLGEFDSLAKAAKYIKENIRDISIKLFQCHKKAYGYYVKEKPIL